MSIQQEKQNNPLEEISLRELILKINDWLLYLKSKWRIIFLIGIITSIIGFAYAYFQSPTYTATMTFALEDEKSNSGLSGALGLASQFGIDLGTSAGGAFSGANLMELMKSRSLVEKTLLNEIEINNKKQTLADYYIDFNKIRQSWSSDNRLINLHYPLNSDRNRFTLQQDSVLGIIYSAIITNSLTVGQKDKKISIVEISLKSTNELFAKSFVEALSNEVSQFYIATKTKKASANVQILKNQTDSIRRELNGAITGLATAQDNTFNLNPSLNIKRTPSQKKQVDIQANTAILNELVKNLELAKVTLRKETPLIQIIDEPILPLKREIPSKTKALLVGGIIGIFISSMFLLGMRFWHKLGF